MAVKCYYHPETSSAGTCINCNQPVCVECKVVLGGETYCTVCADKLFVRRDQVQQVQPVQGIKQTAIAPVKYRNWYEAHLNLTILAAWGVAFIIAFFVGFFLAAFKPDISDRELQIIGLIIGTVVLLPVGSWVLKQKNRNPWWLLLLVVPFGWVLFLLLENRSPVQR